MIPKRQTTICAAWGQEPRGGFSFPTANELLWGSKPSVMVYDITSGAVDGMCEAWHSIVTKEPIGVRVNLLFDCARHGVTLKSGMSREGHVEIVNNSRRNVLVRRPAWVSPKDFQVESTSEKTWISADSSYLLTQGDNGPVTVRIQFPMNERRTVEGLLDLLYTIDWRGDQIVGMCPQGRNLAMFPACK